MHWGNVNGTIRGDRIATLQCSGAAPCPGIDLHDNTLFSVDQDKPVDQYLCENVVGPEGFECTAPCDGNCR